jgi:hypothetical protein
MTSGSTTISINKTARLAGWLYLALIPFSVLGFFYVPSVLIVPGDAGTTSRNILASELLFRTGTVSWLVGHIILIFLALVLYRLFKPVNKDHAVLMVVLALLCVPIVFLNEVNSLAALHLLQRSPSDAQVHAQVMLFLDMRQSGILCAQVFFGLWLFPLGLLMYRSGFLPKVLGVLMLIAAAAYLTDAITQLLFPSLPTISQFTFIGELLFPLWLVIKGVNGERWRQLPPA